MRLVTASCKTFSQYIVDRSENSSHFVNSFKAQQSLTENIRQSTKNLHPVDNCLKTTMLNNENLFCT